MKNHEKPTWNYKKLWQTMKNQPGTMKNHEKPTWNHEKPWRTMTNHDKPWKTNLEPQLILFTTATTGGGVLFWAGVIVNIKKVKMLPILAHFAPFWQLCREMAYFLVYFLLAKIMCWCTKMDK